MTTIPKNTPIAPSAYEKHTVAFRKQPNFQPEEPVRVISTHNPYRPTSHGYHLFEQVLRVKTDTTIEQILTDAHAIGYRRVDTMRHLRWLYTWGNFLEISGKQHFPPPEELEHEKYARKSIRTTR